VTNDCEEPTAKPLADSPAARGCADHQIILLGKITVVSNARFFPQAKKLPVNAGELIAATAMGRSHMDADSGS